MKKIIFLMVLSVFVGGFLSCEKDQSLDPRPQLIDGQFARLDITSKVLNSDDPENSFFGGRLTSPSGKIVEYKLYVKRRDGFGVSTDYSLVKTVTSFPTDLKIYDRDIATALGIPAEVIGFGDEYYFYAESFDARGNKANWYNLSATVQGAPGMKNAYRFRTTSQNQAFVSNPLNLLEYDNYVNP
jgi:hypothetical protein